MGNLPKPIREIFQDMLDSYPKDSPRDNLVIYIGKHFHNEYKYKTFKGIPVVKYFIPKFDAMYLINQANFEFK